MDNTYGESFSIGWVKRSEESRGRQLEQLKALIEGMLRITLPKGTGTANVDGGPLQSPRLMGS